MGFIWCICAAAAGPSRGLCCEQGLGTPVLVAQNRIPWMYRMGSFSGQSTIIGIWDFAKSNSSICSNSFVLYVDFQFQL